MSDIVERLRRDAACSSHCEAADEIVWLRKENARLAAELGKAHSDIVPWIEKACRLGAEIDLMKNKLGGENV